MGALRKPEIMSPAGYWSQLRAAIEAGADAVHFRMETLLGTVQGGVFSPRVV